MIPPAFIALLCVAQTDQVQTARGLFDRASAAYERNDFAAAVELFESAYQISPRPQIAFSLAQAHRRQATAETDQAKRKSAVERAIRAYRQYIDLAPQGSRRSHAEQFIAQLEQLLGYIARAESSTTRTELIVMSNVKSGIVSVDSKEVSLMTPIEVSPGTHVVTVEAPGYFPYRNEVTIPDGRSIPVDAELRPRPSIIQVAAPDGADVLLDGRLQGSTPLVPLEVPAGRHFIAVTDRGTQPFVRELDLEIGEEVRIVADLESTTQRTVSYVMFGLAGAFALGSIGSGALAVVSHERAEELSEKQMEESLTVGEAVRHGELLDRRDRAFASSIAIGSGALVSLTIGVLLFLFDQPQVPSPGLRF